MLCEMWPQCLPFLSTLLDPGASQKGLISSDSANVFPRSKFQVAELRRGQICIVGGATLKFGLNFAIFCARLKVEIGLFHLPPPPPG